MALKTRDAKVKSMALPSALSACMGITEPAIFGVNLRFMTPFVGGLAGGACGALYASLVGLGATGTGVTGIYREILLENIEYDYLIQDSSIDREQLDEIVDLMLETVCTSRKTIRIAGDDYPAELVKSKFMKLNSEHIRFVFDCRRENTTKVRNIKQYLRAMLFNAPSTISNYYTSLVAHDMAQPDWGKPKSGLPDYSCSPDESL